ncbi:MAG TPA: RNA polymerase sigma-70 factor [Puia sp.]|nr:RNA polymerase sigma-70 factor [Puia sp.]
MDNQELNIGKELLRRIAKDDHDAFRQLFHLYTERLFAAVYHYTKSHFIAEELVQEVFISCWRHRHQLGDVQDPTAYLYRMVFNHITNYLKKEASQRRVLERAAARAGNVQNVTLQQVEANEMQRIIADAVERLPAQKKLIYRLSKEQGLNYREIAGQLNISPNTAKNHLVEAMKLLRSYLRDNAVMLGVIIKFFFPH